MSVFAVVLRGVVCEFAAPAFLAPGVAVGGEAEEGLQRGDAGGYDADVHLESSIHSPLFSPRWVFRATGTRKHARWNFNSIYLRSPNV